MKQYDSLLEAAEFASTLATGWRFAYSSDEYEKTALLSLAETSDSENPIGEDSFYVVSPSGAIGLCEDGEDIDWQFLSNPDTGEDLPTTFAVAPQVKFCPKCGAPVVPGARFCNKCGGKF